MYNIQMAIRFELWYSLNDSVNVRSRHGWHTIYVYIVCITYSIQYETILYSAHCTEYDLADVLEKCFHHGDTLEMRHFLRPLVHIRPRYSIVSMHFFRRSLCDCNRQGKKLNAKGFLEVSNSTIVHL